MNDAKLLEQLQAARALLDASYIKWKMDDGQGGHCGLGAIRSVAGCIYWDHGLVLMQMVDASARALHPELTGRVARHNSGTDERFDQFPLEYVNNQLGKEATLAVFDAAILELEIKLASAQASEPELVAAVAER